MSEFEENEEFNIEEERKNSRRKSLRALLFTLVVVLGAVLVFMVVRNRSLEAERQRQEAEIKQTYERLDSMSNELDQKIITISQLGGEIDTLLSIKNTLENDKKDLLNRDRRRIRNINELKGRVQGYQELLIAKDEEIKQLKAINEQLLTENTDLKTEKSELNQSLRDADKLRQELEDKVKLAAKLSIEGLTVTAVNSRGKERQGEFRNRHIDKLKIEFFVSENSVAPIEGKELLIRVVAPDKNVLFDVARGSGTFMFESREQFYTAKKEILYDRKKQQVSLFYDKGSDYSLGRHEVEIYTDDYLLGKGAFNVK